MCTPVRGFSQAAGPYAPSWRHEVRVGCSGADPILTPPIVPPPAPPQPCAKKFTDPPHPRSPTDTARHPPVETVTTVRNIADGFRFDKKKNFTLRGESELGIEAGSRRFLHDSQDGPLSFW